MDLIKLLMRSQELVNELGRPGVDAKATVTELQVSQSGVRQVASLQREADNSGAMQPAVPAAVHFLVTAGTRPSMPSPSAGDTAVMQAPRLIALKPTALFEIGGCLLHGGGRPRGKSTRRRQPGSTSVCCQRGIQVFVSRLPAGYKPLQWSAVWSFHC